MIPNALATTGDYADVWSQLKSMDHALDRVMHSEKIGALTALDKERLLALAAFLKESLSPKPEEELVTVEALRSRNFETEGYIADFDLRQTLREVKEFEAWHLASKMGMERKIQKLTDAIEHYVRESSHKLLAKAVETPEEEFRILRNILTVLLRQVSTVMHT